MAFFSPPPGAGRHDHDFAHLLASPGGLLPSPLGPALFASPQPGRGSKAAAAFAVQEGRLSFDMLLREHDSQQSSQGACALAALRGASDDAARDDGCAPPSLKARSASHLELFALGAPERPKLSALAAEQLSGGMGPDVTDQRMLPAAVAAKLQVATTDFGSNADGDTIKAVWGVQLTEAGDLPASQQQQQVTGAGGQELTLADHGKGSSDNTSVGEEGGQQATSTLKPLQQGAAEAGANALKRSLPSEPVFSFPVTALPGALLSSPAEAAAAGDATLKRRRVRYDRMRELEAQVQRVRQLGDALKHSLRQAEVQHTAIVSENEQLWNALLHIHASLRAAHAAHLRQQVAMHAAAVAAAAAMPAPPQEPEAPSPNTLFGGLFSPDDDELAAACGMFISPAKHMHGAGATAAPANKPRKLFLEDEAKAAVEMQGGSDGRPALPHNAALGELPAELPPALWVQAA